MRPTRVKLLAEPLGLINGCIDQYSSKAGREESPLPRDRPVLVQAQHGEFIQGKLTARITRARAGSPLGSLLKVYEPTHRQELC